MSPETQQPAAGKPPAGPVYIPAGRPKPEFTFKPTGSGGPKTELPPNPAIERFKMPEPPSPIERMLPVIKGVVGGLAVLILLLVALYFVALPGSDDAAVLDRASQALRTVKAVPTQHQPVLALKDATLPLRNTADADLVAGLLAVIALGEMRTGDKATGMKQCEYIGATYPGAPAAQLVKYDALSEPCKNCKGTGRVAEALKSSRHVQAMDGDTVPCLKCHAKGRILSDAAVDGQYAKALDAAEAAIKTQNRYGAVMSFLLRTQARLHRTFGRAEPAIPAPVTGATNAPATEITPRPAVQLLCS
jgi:hypothetical protein